jgi:antitoxin (DNA-binding transcriptional repressor) of toxin-antitoxin stability system
MKSIPISEFKSKCIAVLKEAQKSGQALVVTWRGKPMARIDPIRGEQKKRPLGVFRGRMSIVGDIVHADTTEDWEVLQ